MPIGFHVSKSAGGRKRLMATALEETVENLRSYGFKSICAQIFVSGPQSFREILTEEDKLACRRVIREHNLPVVIHGSYIDHPWNRLAASVHNIKQELRIAAAIGATGVIVHLGAGASSDENLAYVLETVTDLPEEVRENVTLWLEIHTAKSSTATYETTKKIKNLFERISKVNTRGMRIGLCIDTAHIFACGLALDSSVVMEKWLSELPKVPLMLHLNDSASTLGSGKDMHDALTIGNIWKNYNRDKGFLPIEDSGLVSILNWAESNDIVTILERNEEDLVKDLTLIQQLGYFQE